MNFGAQKTFVGVVLAATLLTGCSILDDAKPLPSTPNGGWVTDNSTGSTQGNNTPKQQSTSAPPVKVNYSVPSDQELQTALTKDYQLFLKSEEETNLEKAIALTKQMSTGSFLASQQEYLQQVTVGQGFHLQKGSWVLNSSQVVSKTSTSAVAQVTYEISGELVKTSNGQVVSPMSSTKVTASVSLARNGNDWLIYDSTQD